MQSCKVLRRVVGSAAVHYPYHQSLLLSTRAYSSLRILFCGADEFSIQSLRAIYELKTAKPDRISSIDVLCRPDKRVGAGLKRVREVPIKSVAQSLQLPLHQIDTFTGWTPSQQYDLVIAVSFGLLVPSRILKSCQYGGLNVHPSLLPDFRGPAPIHHAMLRRRTHTGVTLQTMHPAKFDHGHILAQTPAPGIPIPPEARPHDLIEQLGAYGAAMLHDGIERGLFEDPKPLDPTTIAAAHQECHSLEHAPKLTPEDRRIDWRTWSAAEILLRDRVLGRLWDTETVSRASGNPDNTARTVFGGPWQLLARDGPPVSSADGDERPGQPVLMPEEGMDQGLGRLYIRTSDGQLVTPETATIAGGGKDKGMWRLARMVESRDSDFSKS